MRQKPDIPINCIKKKLKFMFKKLLWNIYYFALNIINIFQTTAAKRHSSILMSSMPNVTRPINIFTKLHFASYDLFIKLHSDISLHLCAIDIFIITLYTDDCDSHILCKKLTMVVVTMTILSIVIVHQTLTHIQYLSICRLFLL